MGGPCFLVHNIEGAPPPEASVEKKQVVIEQQKGLSLKLPSATAGIPRRKRAIGPGATDNFQVAPFQFAGQLWQSVEQCYQAFKFNDEKGRELIQMMVPFGGESDHSHGMRVWSAGGRYNCSSMRSDWDAVKVEVMLRACRAKLAAHANLREELLGTGDVPIVGAPSTQWQSKATGNHNWSKWNGRIQELVREELKAAAQGAALSEHGMELAKAFTAHMAAEGGAVHPIPG
jgi:predicted NAD-dependent protein-ADP-ribosyltransferase YbiA (DUF1768 family)